MCGIVAYAGVERAAERIYEGLLRLEYRGYDSAGIATSDGENIYTARHAGRVRLLSEDLKNLLGCAGVGHTRWATHGEPSDKNAHPHRYGAFSVVHNGIIENYREIRARLEDSGEKFESDTDSEVIAHLMNLYYDGDLVNAIRRVSGELEGSFAFAVVCPYFNGAAAAKRKSTLVVGCGVNGNYIASDVPAIADCVNGVILPEDGDVVLISPEKVAVYGTDGEEVKRPIHALEADVWSAALVGYPHYMLKETEEGEHAVRATALSFTGCDLKKLSKAFNDSKKVIITGCGTAYNSGLAGKIILNGAGVDCDVEIASELKYYPPSIDKQTLLIAVSQSGETADTLEAAQAFKDAGAKVIAVTNVKYSAICRVADAVVYLRAGSEICVAATKSYVAQLACFYLLGSLIKDGEDGCLKTAEELIKTASFVKTVMGSQEAAKISEACVKSSAVFFLGRGMDCALAVEGSLKLKEVSYIFSDGYPAGELKHGTLALVDGKTLSVVIICDEKTGAKCENAVEQITSRKGKVAVITCLDGVAARLEDKADIIWRLPTEAKNYSPILTAVALQIIAYKAAVMRGLNPDKPRNLAKSVTVE